jgi:rhomboid family protein
MNQNALQAFINQWGLIPTQILAGQRLITIFTAMFLHAGWLHLIGNMVFLWVFGDNVEDILGHIPYLIFYLLGGIAAAAAHTLFNPTSNIPSLGASGAIAAVLGAYIIMFPHARVRTLIFFGIGGFVTRISAIIFLGIWFATQLLNGVASLGVDTAQTSGVAVWAHVGGFVFGLIVGLLYKGRASRASYVQY